MLKKDQCVLIFGQCGCGKTTTVNRLLGVDWNTCAYAVGTTLPHIKTYETLDNCTLEKIWEPYQDIDMRTVKCQLECHNFFNGELQLKREVADTIRWDLTDEEYSETKLADSVSKCTFVDLMGFAESISTDIIYYTIFREFAAQATQVLFISDATCRAYGEDRNCLDFIHKHLPSLDRFVIGLNKVDAIALENGQQAGQDPNERQQRYIREKISAVKRDFSYIAPWANITDEDIIPYSAISGWNFNSLRQLYFSTPSTQAG